MTDFEPSAKEGVVTLDNANQYVLSIRLQPDGFSFSLHSPLENDTFIYRKESYQPSEGEERVPLKTLLERHPALLNSSFKRVNILLATQRFMVVPPHYNSEESTAAYQTLFQGEGETLLCNHLSGANVQLCFGIESALHAWLTSLYPEAHWLHPLSPLCDYLHRKSRYGNSTKVYALLHEEELQLLCFNRQGLLLANTFHCPTTNDAAYFVLSLWKELQLNPQNDELLLRINPEQREELTSLLKTYIEHVVPVIFPPEVFELGRESMLAPFDLITLPLCEL